MDAYSHTAQIIKQFVTQTNYWTKLFLDQNLWNRMMSPGMTGASSVNFYVWVEPVQYKRIKKNYQ